MWEAASLMEPPSSGPLWESLRKDGPSSLDRYSPQFNRLLSMMMQSVCTKRLSAKEILAFLRQSPSESA